MVNQTIDGLMRILLGILTSAGYIIALTKFYEYKTDNLTHRLIITVAVILLLSLLFLLTKSLIDDGISKIT